MYSDFDKAIGQRAGLGSFVGMVVGEVGGEFGLCGSFGWWWKDGLANIGMFLCTNDDRWSQKEKDLLVYGKSAFFRPHTHNLHDIAQLAKEAGGGFEGCTAGELTAGISQPLRTRSN
jgi:hypothetical protein